ncbi:hypothetical protein DLAC_01514 [Tieghemostelium lacteum]|uniref:Phosphoesterase n=1 Tax=Tieghemostelium lacteum TaxID=361077 RepID=A0A152A5L4_TIELA|nr:hypothetical protein DLAC_01514 [Tieghemostelium lacteum]|eukprot:KYR01523.1 hypothetical protein DLAC_01514 [Tieghemostelium lacteum]
MKNNIITLVFVTIAAVLIGSINTETVKDYQGANIVIQWNNALLTGIVETSPPPTVGSRSIALVHTAMYDAWAFYNSPARGVYMLRNLTNGYPPTDVKSDDMNKAISYAAYRMVSQFYSKSMNYYNNLMGQYGYDINDNSTQTSSGPSGVGNLAAKYTMENRVNDGSNQLGNINEGKPYSDYTNYSPANDVEPAPLRSPDNWKPLLVPQKDGNLNKQSFTTPHWTMVRPFSMKSGAFFRPKNPPPYAKFNSTRDDLIKSAQELIGFTSNITDFIKSVAEYWAKGPNTVLTPGHWCQIAQYVSERDKHSVDKDIKLFFMLGNAVMDAGIACWDTKRFFDNARPVTMIPYLFKGTMVNGWHGPCQNHVDYDLADWIPYQDKYFVTPSFPDFTSGHSTFSASAAKVLQMFTGSDAFGDSVTIKKGSSQIEATCSDPVPAEDIVLKWDTFSAASEQAGLSRRYGGIHYDFSDYTGRDMGTRVGEQVVKRSRLLFKGVDPDTRTVVDGGDHDDTPNSSSKLVSSVLLLSLLQFIYYLF